MGHLKRPQLYGSRCAYSPNGAPSSPSFSVRGNRKQEREARLLGAPERCSPLPGVKAV